MLVSFNPPIKLRPQEHTDLLSTPTNDPKDAIKQLTKDMEEQIRGGTLDAPSWEVLRIGDDPSLENCIDRSPCSTEIIRAAGNGIVARRIRPFEPTIRRSVRT